MTVTHGILDQVVQVVNEVVDLPNRVGGDAEIESIEGWDSIASVNIQLSIEECFGVAIPLHKFAQLNAIRDLAELVDAASQPELR